MNVVFFLTPKSDIAWIPVRSTLRQAVERMKRRGYTAVPLLDSKGRYVGTLTEGDLLRKLGSKPALSYAEASRVRLTDVPRRLDIRAVGIDAEMEELFERALAQNFVPVVDGRRAFIGIVRRRTILEYFAGVLRARGVPLDQGVAPRRRASLNRPTRARE